MECLYQASVNGLFTYWFMDKEIICSPRPKMLFRDQRLHSELKPAVNWSQGQKWYFLHGVQFSKQEWGKIMRHKNQQILSKTILGWANAEKKQAAIKVIGYDNVLKCLKAKTLSKANVTVGDKQLQYEVFEANLKDDDVPARFVKVVCPSTMRKYILRINPRDKKLLDPLAAVASTFQMEKTEYSLIKET